jgi:fumarate hydratase class II
MRACWRTICGGSKSIGYDKASKIAHYAMDNDLTLTGSVVTRAKSLETQLCDL